MTLAPVCPGCGVMGAGCICGIIHPIGLPAHPYAAPKSRVGWQCPVCNAGLAPHVEKCSCQSEESSDG